MTRWRSFCTNVVLSLCMTSVLFSFSSGFTGAAAAASPYEGFGVTAGGSGQSLYRVTTLQDAGPGSLRDAVSRGARYIVFEVAGDIRLTSDIRIKGAYLTIDGTTAPAPGITLRDHGLSIFGSDGAHDIIVQGLRVRNSQGCDGCSTHGGGILIAHDAARILVDRVSVQGSQNFSISVTKGARDITIQRSILAQNSGDTQLLSLINGTQSSATGQRVRRVSMHHTLLIKGGERMPQVKWSETGEQAPETLLDFRNNVVWNWAFMGTTIWKGTRANIVGNYYHDPDASSSGHRRGLYVCTARSTAPQCDGTDPKLYARAYIAGNVSGYSPEVSAYLNSLGTESGPFPAAAVTTTEACTAAHQVLTTAGVRPLDAVDQRYLAEIELVGCATPPPSDAPPPAPEPPTSEPPTPNDPIVEADLLEAEDYTYRSSNVWLQRGQGEHGGDAIGMSHGAWTAYGPFVVGEYGKVNIRVASGNKGGTITFRLGSATGTTVGTINVPNTGGWTSWTTLSTTLNSTTGSQLLYITFSNPTTGGGQMMLLDRLEFVPVEPTVVASPMKIQAEKYTGKNSNLWVQQGQGEGGGDAIGMSHGAWASYGPLSLDGQSTLSLRVASGNKGGTIMVRTGSESGPVIGSLTVPNTGGWSRWSTYTATITPSRGKQDVYMTFANSATGAGQMMLVDWFELRP
ncbi:MAG TPA: carbohydrate-binding protein [Alphaproteobacteria bacterium]|nr:carbohydrate-binding protein [Alphaproteobacteria bacterium]